MDLIYIVALAIVTIVMLNHFDRSDLNVRYLSGMCLLWLVFVVPPAIILSSIEPTIRYEFENFAGEVITKTETAETTITIGEQELPVIQRTDYKVSTPSCNVTVELAYDYLWLIGASVEVPIDKPCNDIENVRHNNIIRTTLEGWNALPHPSMMYGDE